MNARATVSAADIAEVRSVGRWPDRDTTSADSGKPERPDRRKLRPSQVSVPPPTCASLGQTNTGQIEAVLATAGRPLDPRTRRSMEASFGCDFSGVRIHDDALGAATAAAIHAAAFTIDQHVAFAPGRYSPSTDRGRELLAHELAHTLQQRGAQSKTPPLPPGSPLETSAEAAGRAAACGRAVPAMLGAAGIGIARSPVPPEALDDQALAHELESAREEELKHHAYQSHSDLYSYHRLKAEANRRADVRERVRLAFVAVRESIREQARLNAGAAKASADHAVALAELEALAASMGKEDKEEDDEVPAISMALLQGRSAAAGRPLGRAPRRGVLPPSRLSPKGFTDDDVYREWQESENLLTPRDPQTGQEDRRTFVGRYYAAVAYVQQRRNRELILDETPQIADEGEDAWYYGFNSGLFTVYERDAFEARWDDEMNKPLRELVRRDAARESNRRDMAWVDQGDARASGADWITGFGFGGIGLFPKVARLGVAARGILGLGNAAVRGSSMGLMIGDEVVQGRKAIASGKPEEIVGAALPPLVGLAMHGLIRGGDPEPPRSVGTETFARLPEDFAHDGEFDVAWDERTRGEPKLIDVSRDPELRTDISGKGDVPGQVIPRSVVQKVNNVVGSTVAEVPAVRQCWEEAKASVIKNRNPITPAQWLAAYDASVQPFWRNVWDNLAARAHFTDNGFVFPKRGNAPLVKGYDAFPRKFWDEFRVSLDHTEPKGTGENWRFSLDATKLELRIHADNTMIQNLEKRHPSLRRLEKPR